MGKRIIKVLSIIKRSLLEIIYPRDSKCIVCGEEDTYGLCHKCKSSIIYCDNGELCLGYYKGVLKELILKFKFKGRFDAGEELIKLVEERLVNFIEKDYIITYIPIGKESLKMRGFNQCEYLAKELGLRNNFTILNTLKRVKDSKIQKTLKREERLKNIKGVFEIINKEEVKGKKFIILDDVITTGATLHEAERVLKEAGVVQIKLLTMAKSYV